jgi:hypothetical protein
VPGLRMTGEKRSRRLTAPRGQPTAGSGGPGVPAFPCGQAVERYLGEVAARLPGPRKAHSGIVAELRAGLHDATDSHQSAGLPPAHAVQAAIREFGDPGLVADGFLPEIAAGHARRAATVLLVTGPLVGLLWLATAAASHPAIRIAAFWQWTTLPAGLGAGIQLVAVAVAGHRLGRRGRHRRHGPAEPVAARQAAPCSAGRRDRRVRRRGRRRARPPAPRSRAGCRPGKAVPAPGCRGQRGPAADGQPRRIPLPGHARQPHQTVSPLPARWRLAAPAAGGLASVLRSGGQSGADAHHGGRRLRADPPGGHCSRRRRRQRRDARSR